MGAEPAVNAVYYNKIMELEGEARRLRRGETRSSTEPTSTCCASQAISTSTPSSRSPSCAVI